MDPQILTRHIKAIGFFNSKVEGAKAWWLFIEFFCACVEQCMLHTHMMTMNTNSCKL